MKHGGLYLSHGFRIRKKFGVSEKGRILRRGREKEKVVEIYELLLLYDHNNDGLDVDSYEQGPTGHTSG